MGRPKASRAPRSAIWLVWLALLGMLVAGCVGGAPSAGVAHIGTTTTASTSLAGPSVTRSIIERRRSQEGSRGRPNRPVMMGLVPISPGRDEGAAHIGPGVDEPEQRDLRDFEQKKQGGSNYDAEDQIPVPVPMAAAARMVAGVVTRCTEPVRILKTTPPPMKPIPVTMPAIA